MSRQAEAGSPRGYYVHVIADCAVVVGTYKFNKRYMIPFEGSPPWLPIAASAEKSIKVI